MKISRQQGNSEDPASAKEIRQIRDNVSLPPIPVNVLPPLPILALEVTPAIPSVLPPVPQPQELLPQAPLPEAPLPEVPLPEAPLPEVPLPEAPLPQAPLPQVSLNPVPLAPDIAKLSPPKSLVVNDVANWFKSLSKSEQRLVVCVGHGIRALDPKDRSILFETCLPEERFILSTCAELVVNG